MYDAFFAVSGFGDAVLFDAVVVGIVVKATFGMGVFDDVGFVEGCPSETVILFF